MVTENQTESGKASLDNPGQNKLFLYLREYFNRIVAEPVFRRIFRISATVIIVFLIIVFIFSIVFYIIPYSQQLTGGRKTELTSIDDIRNNQVYKRQITILGNEVRSLSRKFTFLSPGQSYLVINTTDNRFSLYRNKKLIREGFCSSGSYTLLTTVEGSKHWIFKTPKGKFRIQEKLVRPLWIRPDWSFIEEGLPVPPPNDDSRYEYGVLGDYAMSLGDGYLIHGTLYKRFLGMPVTHGCVRLNDEDLEAIYRSLDIGSKVFIF
jgi:lipoprotein-anchoring transpeptidase ErfK/SrfK